MNVKDREELVVLKNDMSYVKVNIDKLGVKLDKFIDSADRKYATNDKVNMLEEQFNTTKNKSHSWVISVVGWSIVLVIFIADKLFS